MANAIANGKSDEQQFYGRLFDEFDKNKSGALEPEEINELITPSDEVSRQRAGEVFQTADRNVDRAVDVEEFSVMVQNQTYKPWFEPYFNKYVNFVVPRRRRRHRRVRRHLQLDGGVSEVDGVYDESYTCCPPPVAMFLISALEMACFVTDETNEKDSTLTGSGITARELIYDPRKRYEAWRYLTYMFVHIGYVHLLTNLAVQLVLGIPLEMVHKWWRVMLVYFAGVVAGSLGTSVTDPRVYLAGASGGVYALITAHIATIIMNWNEMTFPLLQLSVFLFITTVDTGTAIYNRYWLDVNESIGYTAHFAGAVAGLLMGICFLKNFINTKRERYLWWLALVVYIVCMGAMIVMNVVWSGHFPKQR